MILNFEAWKELMNEIKQLVSKIEEKRLEHDPDISAIRDLQEVLKQKRLDLSRLNDEVPFCPV